MKGKDLGTLLAAARPLIKLAIAEDIGPGDATSRSTLAGDTVLHGRDRRRWFYGAVLLPVLGAILFSLSKGALVLGLPVGLGAVLAWVAAVVGGKTRALLASE